MPQLHSALVVCTLTVAACGAAPPMSSPVAPAEEAGVRTTWTDGTYVLEEWRGEGEVELTLSRMDDAYFDAAVRSREPGSRCLALGASGDSSFDCFQPYRDEWIRIEVHSAPLDRTVRVLARSNGIDPQFAAQNLALRPLHTVDIVAERFALDVVRDGERAADPSCEAEYGPGDDRCSTLAAVLGTNATSLISGLVRRVREKSASATLAPVDALMTLRHMLQSAARACGATLTEACIDQVVSAERFQGDSDEIRRPVRIRPELATEARGLWMPEFQLRHTSADYIELWPSGMNTGSFLIDIARTCGLVGPAPNSDWQPWRCPSSEEGVPGPEFRVRLIGDRLDVRPVQPPSDEVPFASGQVAYRTYRRVDILREIFAQATAEVGQSHGSETSAILGSLIDELFGENPEERSVRLHSALRTAITQSGLQPDDLHREAATQLVQEFVFGVAVNCAQEIRGTAERIGHRALVETFSSCVERTMIPIANRIVARQLARHGGD